MFETMKLGTKISAGYAGVLLITSLVTAFTLYEVNVQSNSANTLSLEVVPQVGIANDLERFSLMTMRNMKMYELTNDRSHYDAAMETLAKVDAALVRAKEHATKYPGQTAFKQASDRVSILAREYRVQAEKTKGATDALLTARDAMGLAAGQYFTDAEAFHKVRPDSLEIQELMTLGTEARMTFWRASAVFKPKEMDDAVKILGRIDAQIEKTRSNYKQDELVRLLDGIRNSAKDYGAKMREVQAAWYLSDQVSEKRNEAALQVLEASKAVAVAGIETTDRASEEVSHSLGELRLVVGSAC